MQPAVGVTIAGRYRLERALGAGATATVWRAFDSVLERTVAVKVLTRGLGGETHKLERFRREARALAALGHPHIVTVIDTGEDAGTHFIVLEYVAGETLKQRIARAGPLPTAEALAYAIEIGRALAAAHERGIVHRDVKAQNILLDPDGGAKLTDFGIARRDTEHGLTEVGRVLASTDYVAPEQAIGREVTGQSDLYSLGIVLYEALTGTVPFSAANRVAVAAMHVREPVPDLLSRRPDASAALAATVERATAKRLERRYPDARAMLVDLEAALAVEAARSGMASGEAGAVLRTLPPSAARRVPLRVRHPGSLALSAGAVALFAAAVALLAIAGIHANKPATRLVAASLVGARTTAYNPFGTGVDNAGLAPLALAAGPGKAWLTSRYAGGSLRKPGVGVYVSVATPLAARALSLATTTPGFDVEVWGGGKIVPYVKGQPQALGRLGWRLLGAANRVSRRVRILLHGPRRAAFRRYLVWITKLEPGAPGAWVSAAVSAVRLLVARPVQGA